MKRVKRKAILLLVASLLVVNLGACKSQAPELKIYSEEPQTQDELTEAVADNFRQLAEARLGKNLEQIDTLAKEILTEKSYTEFMRYYRDYLSKIESTSKYIVIETYYKEAQNDFNIVKQTALEYDLIDENGNLTAKATGDKSWLTSGVGTTASTDETAEKQTAEKQTAETQPAEAQPEAEPETVAETEEVAPTETETTEEVAPTETETTAEVAETQPTQAETQATTEANFPTSKDALMSYVDSQVDYIGEGEEVIELSENRQMPFMLLGWESLYLGERVDPITREEFDNSTYEEMANRARRIIYLYQSDHKAYLDDLNADDTRTEEEKLADLEKTKENYKEYLAYAEKENYLDEGGLDDLTVPLAIMAQVYETDFTNPETSDFIKTNEQGQHVVYWEDIGDTASTLNFTVFDHKYTLDLKNYQQPITLYSDLHYTQDSWRLFIDPHSTDYPTRILQGLSSTDIKDFSLLIEYRLTPDYKIELTEEQIKSILDIQ